jgi:PilZ domain-containing protein
MEREIFQETVRGLSAGAEVMIDLNPEPEWDAASFAALVTSVGKSSARLSPVDEPSAELRARLKPGALGELTFVGDAGPTALRGIAKAHRFRDELRFVVAEAVKLTDRRTADRVPFVASVRASLMADDGRVVGTTSATATKNLSLDGVLVARRPTLGSGRRWTIELTLPSASAPVQCEPVLARETGGYLALKFVNLGDSDRRELATALVASEV